MRAIWVTALEPDFVVKSFLNLWARPVSLQPVRPREVGLQAAVIAVYGSGHLALEKIAFFQKTWSKSLPKLCVLCGIIATYGLDFINIEAANGR